MAGRDYRDRDNRSWNRGWHDRGVNQAHNPYEIRMPGYQEPISVNDDHPEDTSVIVVDTRDDRMISPFQTWLVSEIIMGTPKLSMVVAMFQGWRVSVLSFQCGGRTYSAGPNGTVVAGDFARSRWELRVCSRASDDAVGNDADRIEFRFRDANNRIHVKAARASVPATWLTVNHISGPNLVRTIQEVRRGGARVEGPEQTEQFAQLAAIHQSWWAQSVAAQPDEVGAKVIFVGGLDGGNFHIQSSSKFLSQQMEIVPTEALATMQHDHSVAVAAPQGPPALTTQAWLTAAEAGQELGQPAVEEESSEQFGGQCGECS